MSGLKYSALKIEIPEGTPSYIDEKGIRKIVERYAPKLQAQYVDSLKLDELEAKIEKVAAIRRVEVFNKMTSQELNLSMQLVVRVYQREPIVRVITDKSNYYMDEEGVRIDAKNTYAAKVPLVTGVVSEEYMRNDVLPLIKYIGADPFWSAQIKDIKVESDGELSMIPLVGSQVILFGKPINFEEKFRNLFALYDQGFSKMGWGKYETIDLKYKGQVVCSTAMQ
ncbi:MAG: cell division protein FtsQ/DivIB [Mangrovibacterium sp.]